MLLSLIVSSASLLGFHIYIYKVLYYLHISLYISLYIFIYLCISLYIFIYLYIIFIYLSFFQHLILGIQYLTGLQHTGEAASESGIQWLNYDGDSQGFMGVSGISWYIYIYTYYIWLVVLTILKNDGVRQWEGWHPFYMKWKIEFMFQTTNQMIINHY